MNFMKLNPDSDGDMTDVQGSGDAVEEAAGVKVETEPGVVAENGDSEGTLSLGLDDGVGLMKVLQAFKLLKEEFDGKFKVMWS
jgi:hypothetical protein